jgi:lysophospholipase L1-like esterase
MPRGPLALLLALATVACVAHPQTQVGGQLYIALGDSLTAGVGSSDRLSHNFPSLVAQALGLAHMNLGHPGDTSADILSHGHLDLAVAETLSRARDDDPGNDVALITITVGGNDMLAFYEDHFLTGQCPDIPTVRARPDCVKALEATIRQLGDNLGRILSRLREAAPQAEIVVFTLYNPFAGQDSPLAQMGDLVLEGGPDPFLPQGVNDVIREAAKTHGAKVADAFPVISGRRDLIAQDGIHPNDRGYEVMAQLVLKALQPTPQGEEHEEIRGGGAGGGPSGEQRSPAALPRGGARPPAGATPSAP